MVKNAIIKSIYLCLLELNTDDMFAAKTYVYGHSLPSPGTKKIKNTFWTKQPHTAASVAEDLYNMIMMLPVLCQGHQLKINFLIFG